MTFDEIKKKLEDNNLSNYIDIFEKNHLFDIDVLQSMTNDDYLSIGISIIGDRKKLLSIFSKGNLISNTQKIWNIENHFGEKIYKEVIISGKKVQRWCTLNNIEKYDIDKNLIYNKSIDPQDDTFFEEWNEYDSYGNVIITRGRREDGSVYTNKIIYEYDSFGHMIGSTGFGHPIYKYDKDGNMVYSEIFGSNGTFYEYDSQGRVIREYSDLEDKNGKKRQCERWYEYDEMGNLIHDIGLNLILGIKNERWISYNNNKEISEKHVTTYDDQNPYVRNTIYEYDENGNCIYELCTYNQYEKSRLVDSWEEETFYEYIKDGDIDMKYTYMTEKKQNLF